MKTKNEQKKKAIHYGELLQQRLKEKGVSKTHAAKELGCTRQWVNKLILSGNFTAEKLVIVKELIK